MTVILILLFLLTPIFRRKENQKSELERKYFELLTTLKHEQNDAAMTQLKEYAKVIYGEEEFENKTLRDLEAFKNT